MYNRNHRKENVIYYPRVKGTVTYKKLYRCPACGDVLTDAEYDADCATGGGYCYCQFKDGDRILTGYDIYILQQTRKDEKDGCIYPDLKSHICTNCDIDCGMRKQSRKLYSSSKRRVNNE